MKKRLFTIFLTMFLCITPAVPAFAEAGLPRLVDEADLLPDGDEADLLGKLDEISERQQVDVVVVTVNSTGGAAAADYADDFYDNSGYGFGEGRDGILLLISMEERDWYISTSGYGITVVTDAGRGYIAEGILGYLSGGCYAEAFTVFADLCDEFITQANADTSYDGEDIPKKPSWLFSLGISVVVGFLISLCVTAGMRGKLKSVHSRQTADSYVRSGSMRLARKSDLFLYKHVDRREKSKEQPQGGGAVTHRSSSGGTHGGGGGKF